MVGVLSVCVCVLLLLLQETRGAVSERVSERVAVEGPRRVKSLQWEPLSTARMRQWYE
jgi:hypothetical protein